MKKFCTLVVGLIVAATTLYGANYKHSIGIVAGSGIGAQYKVMVLPNFTIIDEFGYLGSLCAAGKGFNMATLGAIDNLVLAYQATAAEGQGLQLDWFIGGQLKAGYLASSGGFSSGLIGLGAAAGIDVSVLNAPIAFSFDFRPGYGCMLSSGWGSSVAASHVFDWTLNLAVRYTF